MTDVAAPPTLSAEEVHWKMRQIRDALGRISEEVATCDQDRKKLRYELELIDLHQERVTKADREYVAMLERELEAHLLNLRATDDRIKSVKTPWGDITSRAQDPEYRRDDATLLAWSGRRAAVALLSYMRTKTTYTPDWDALKKASRIENGRLVMPDGEVVPGVEVVERGPKVVVEVTP